MIEWRRTIANDRSIAAGYALLMPSTAKPAPIQPLRVRVAPEELRLEVWPLVQRPVESLVQIVAAAAASVAVGWWLRQPIVAGLAGSALAVVLWRTWLPVTFEIGVMGVTQTVLGRSRRVPWSSVRGWRVDDSGVLLSPDAELIPLSSLRGLYLPWLDKREKLLASVEYYVPHVGPQA
jgi:hypothetical protein